MMDDLQKKKAVEDGLAEWEYAYDHEFLLPTQKGIEIAVMHIIDHLEHTIHNEAQQEFNDFSHSLLLFNNKKEAANFLRDKKKGIIDRLDHFLFAAYKNYSETEFYESLINPNLLLEIASKEEITYDLTTDNAYLEIHVLFIDLELLEIIEDKLQQLDSGAQSPNISKLSTFEKCLAMKLLIKHGGMKVDDKNNATRYSKFLALLIGERDDTLRRQNTRVQEFLYETEKNRSGIPKERVENLRNVKALMEHFIGDVQVKTSITNDLQGMIEVIIPPED